MIDILPSGIMATCWGYTAIMALRLAMALNHPIIIPDGYSVNSSAAATTSHRQSYAPATASPNTGNANSHHSLLSRSRIVSAACAAAPGVKTTVADDVESVVCFGFSVCIDGFIKLVSIMRCLPFNTKVAIFMIEIRALMFFISLGVGFL